jgi:hypothetical protein
VQVITGGARTFSALAYQNQHPENQNYFAQKLQHFTQTFGDTVGSVAGGFMSNAAELFDKFYGSEAVRLAKAAVRKVKSIWERDDIRELFGIGEIQQAKPIMQRWIMAEPTYRQMFHDQRCDGFSNSYVDMEPGVVGEAHYDYRRVMDGLLVDDEEEGWNMTHYIEDLKEGDVDLELDEQLTILSVWDVVRMHAKAGGEDPGSVYGDKL